MVGCGVDFLRVWAFGGCLWEMGWMVDGCWSDFSCGLAPAEMLKSGSCDGGFWGRRWSGDGVS